MFDFKYFTPTKVVFGKNTEEKVAEKKMSYFTRIISIASLSFISFFTVSSSAEL